MKVIAKLSLILITMTSVGGSLSQTVTLDGLRLCVPSEYMRSSPALAAAVEGLDNTYDSLWVTVTSEEVLDAVPEYQPSTVPVQGKRRHMGLSIIVTNRSAIGGLSGFQKRVLEAGQDEARYEFETELNLYRVSLYEAARVWSLVRWMPERRLPSSSDELLEWIAATCSESTDKNLFPRCSIQRIHGALSYNYSITENNLPNLAGIDALVAGKLKEWEAACEEHA